VKQRGAANGQSEGEEGQRGSHSSRGEINVSIGNQHLYLFAWHLAKLQVASLLVN